MSIPQPRSGEDSDSGDKRAQRSASGPEKSEIRLGSVFPVLPPAGTAAVYRGLGGSPALAANFQSWQRESQ